MKPEAQRIAIAEACGWKHSPNQYGRWFVADPDGNMDVTLPDYLNDLNAMHEAEKVLTEDQKETYIEWLFGERNSESDYVGYIERPGRHYFEDACATAAQRAEAFLRTIGKWEDE